MRIRERTNGRKSFFNFCFNVELKTKHFCSVLKLCDETRNCIDKLSRKLPAASDRKKFRSKQNCNQVKLLVSCLPKRDLLSLNVFLIALLNREAQMQATTRLQPESFEKSNICQRSCSKHFPEVNCLTCSTSDRSSENGWTYECFEVMRVSKSDLSRALWDLWASPLRASAAWLNTIAQQQAMQFVLWITRLSVTKSLIRRLFR